MVKEALSNLPVLAILRSRPPNRATDRRLTSIQSGMCHRQPSFSASERDFSIHLHRGPVSGQGALHPKRPLSLSSEQDDVLDAETSFSIRSITLQAVKPLATDIDYETSGQSSNVAMDEFHCAASEDPAYYELLQCVRTGFPRDCFTLPKAMRPFWKLRDNLYSKDDLVLYSTRVVVPAALRYHV